MSEKKADLATTRTLPGISGKIIRYVLIAIPIIASIFILDIPSRLGIGILREQYYGLYFAMTIPCIFLLVPGWNFSPRNRIPWYDYLLALTAVGCGLYVAFFYEEILRTLGNQGPVRLAFSFAAIAVILEAIRRTGGILLAGVGLFFILYARFTWLAPGVFNAPGTPWPELATYLYLDMNGVFGMTLGVACVIVLAFILFGNLLFGGGGGAFLNDFATSAFGGFRGGPAKMAVIASSLFGMLTGSAAANVASTGVFTIPLMKKVGYKPHVAGAIEAVASTGGTLTPPIMGAAAFVIAEFTGIPYATVAIASIIPALLYYCGVFMQVDLEAAKEGMKGLPRNELPPISASLKKAYLFVVPFTVLMLALFVFDQSAEKSAFYGMGAVFVCACINKKTRFRLDWIIASLEKTGKGILSITAIVCMAGLIIGVVNVCGLGFVLPLYMTQIAGDTLMPVLILVAIASIILGMGMPTVAVYILLGVLMAPTLVELGVPVLAAHLFIQYFGTISQFTPPVCIAAFAAAGIAEADQMKTAFSSMRIGILAYPTPFLFVYSQAFLMEGTVPEILWAMFTAMSACFLLGVALVGYFVRRVPWHKRVLLVPAALLMLTATSPDALLIGLAQDLSGLAIGIMILLSELYARKHARRHGQMAGV